MNLQDIMLTEISQTKKDKHDITYTWNLKKQMNKRNKTLSETEIKRMVTRREGVRGWVKNKGSPGQCGSTEHQPAD